MTRVEIVVLVSANALYCSAFRFCDNDVLVVRLRVIEASTEGLCTLLFKQE